MHCLVEIIGDEYQIISTSENSDDLTSQQSTQPLRIVLNADTIRYSLAGKHERKRIEDQLGKRCVLH
jgi:hypothetical protein